MGVIPLKVVNQYELLLWLYKIVKNKVCHHFQLVKVAETYIATLLRPTTLLFPVLELTGGETAYWAMD
jgi:hypothetical protein